ncbi:ABC transporter substrate-binding protein [Motiliproteus sp. SC1-56]|uniref:substrate-binding periplasmic protein n=1 Tax=Motiliproteus sp. SC1-56 TaxID=2799565 RepID=UPI001A8FC6B5|nr:transporter substrate-binding domain-containing protein [Motiliproteus sp. SC1-56]
MEQGRGLPFTGWRWRAALFFFVGWLCVAVQADTVRLVSFQYPPLVYQENGEVKGVATALVREAFESMGHSVTVEILPWPRSLQYVEHGQADGIFTIFKNPERETFLRYAGKPLIEQVIALYRRSDRPLHFDGALAALIPYRIGVTRAVSYGQHFDRALKELLPYVIQANDERTKFLLLDSGRVDLVVSSTGIADFYRERLGLGPRIVRVPGEIERVPSYLAFSRASKRQLLAPAFAQALEQLKASGRYGEILREHGYGLAASPARHVIARESVR